MPVKVMDMSLNITVVVTAGMGIVLCPSDQVRLVLPQGQERIRMWRETETHPNPITLHCDL